MTSAQVLQGKRGEWTCLQGPIIFMILTAWGKKLFSFLIFGFSYSCISSGIGEGKTSCRMDDGGKHAAVGMVSLQQWGERGVNDLPCCFHYPVQLVPFGHFISKPGCDTAGQNTFDGPPIKADEDQDGGDSVIDEVRSSASNTPRGTLCCWPSP